MASFAFCFGGLSISAHAMAVIISLSWNPDLLDYNLQEGSVVQVIMYNSSADPPSPTHPGSTFGDPVGEYTGPPLSAEPYPGGGHEPDTIDAYDPHAVPEGHRIFYTTQIGPEEYGEHGLLIQLNGIAETYDRLYIRVFGTTDLYQQGYWASYWGISDVYNNDSHYFLWEVDVGEVNAPNKNYFHVIPEPGSLSLALLGAAGLLAGRRRGGRGRREKGAEEN